MATLPLSPQLLSRASEPPNGDAWFHELKYDGYRLLASVERGTVHLYSRSGANWTARLPLIAKAVSALPVDDLHLDGELVYLTEDGFPDFERLWSATRASEQGRLYYQVFDLLRLGSHDLTARPLIERKERLLDLLRDGVGPRLRYVSHVQGNGAEFFTAVDQLGLEGIVCKRAESIYRPGIRSTDWVKVKCFHTQRFAVVGYTTEGARLESLALAGQTTEGGARYAGRVDFGVPRSDETLLRALQLLGVTQTEVLGAANQSNIRWVEPRLTAEVRALKWLPGRSLRHAVLRSVSID